MPTHRQFIVRPPERPLTARAPRDRGPGVAATSRGGFRKLAVVMKEVER